MLTVKLVCPRHRRYDPRRDGEAGIRGGCRGCLKLLEAWRAVMRYVANEEAE